VTSLCVHQPGVDTKSFNSALRAADWLLRIKGAGNCRAAV